MKPLRLSQRATKTPPSPIRKLGKHARDAERKGIKVHRLNIGQPDVDSPPEFFEGLSVYQDSVVKYDESVGSLDLRQSWSDFILRTSNLKVRPEEIIITVGASEALIFAFMTCCDPGDEIIIFEPTYANFIGFAALAGIKLIPVATYLENNFKLPPREEINVVFSNRTRAILLCNPNNPTGTFYTQQDLALLLEICEENNIFLIVDETYREIVFDSLTPFSVQHIAEDNKRVIVIDSLSKRFSLCGARIGCLATSNQEVISAISNIAQARLAAPTIEQFACAHMLKSLDQNYLNSLRSCYESRRDALINALSDIPQLTFSTPSGAFYLVARLPIQNSEHFCRFMLNSFSYEGETIFLAPGAGFYLTPNAGEDTVRIAFVLEELRLIRAVTILKTGLIAYLS
jgi:aspartate aminotransferase